MIDAQSLAAEHMRLFSNDDLELADTLKDLASSA